MENEEGAGTVISAGVVLALIIVFSVLFSIFYYISKSHQIHSSADMASLAAATVYVEGKSELQSCDLAKNVAQKNGVELQSCLFSAGKAYVTVKEEIFGKNVSFESVAGQSF